MSTPHDTHDSAPPPPPPPPGPGPRVGMDEVRDLRRLRRSRGERKVAGVAGGIAHHLDIDPLLVRVLFVVLTIFGGGGLLLYAAVWLLVPEEGTESTVVRADEGLRTVVLVVVGALAAAALLGDSLGGPDFPWPVLVVGLVLLVFFGGRQQREDRAARAADAAPGAPGTPAAPGAPASPAYAAGGTYADYRPPADPRRRGPLLFPFTLALAALAVGVVGTVDVAGVDVPSSAYAASVLGVTGLMLVVGAFYGRAGGLILLGLLAAASTAVAGVVDDSEIGRVEHRITDPVQLRSSYDLGVGELRLDLSDVGDPAALDDRTVRLEQGVGHLLVVVPDDVRVVLDAEVSAGEVKAFGRILDRTVDTDFGDPAAPTLTVDARLAVGQIEIRGAAAEEDR